MKNLIALFSLAICWYGLSAQDTFSIVAVDTATGEVGSAGASCLDASNIAGGVSIIGDLVPGRGAINTQSYYIAANQNIARNKMLEGLAPDQIISYLIANDAQGDSSIRQYGIADIASDGSSRAAAFTGSNCFDYKNHIIGPYYAIQGNILLGQEILDSMEYRFLNSSGSLAERLMAALQGANVPGADSRCLSEGVSSRSAFLRVARPNDVYGQPYLDLVVSQTPYGAEPIDSLQSLFSQWTAPDCSVAIPANVLQPGTNWDTVMSSQTVWVCSGDTLRLGGNFNTVFLEENAAYYGSLGGLNTVYIPSGASYAGGNQTINSIYYMPGSILLSNGPAVNATSCDSIIYELSSAPASICSNSTALDPAEAFPWTAQQQRNLLTISGFASQAGELQLMDLHGQVVKRQTIMPGSHVLHWNLAALAQGLYFLRWDNERQPQGKKVLWQSY